MPSRGLSAKELSTNAIWWNGPELLYKAESEWPVSEPTNAEDDVALLEIVKTPVATVHSLVNTSATMLERIDQLVDIKRFHDVTSLLRVTALVIKAARRFKNRARNEKEETRLSAADKQRHSLKRLNFLRAKIRSLSRQSTCHSLVYSFKMVSSNARED